MPWWVDGLHDSGKCNLLRVYSLYSGDSNRLIVRVASKFQSCLAKTCEIDKRQFVKGGLVIPITCRPYMIDYIAALSTNDYQFVATNYKKFKGGIQDPGSNSSTLLDALPFIS